jgi:hypothetical protein
MAKTALKTGLSPPLTRASAEENRYPPTYEATWFSRAISVKNGRSSGPNGHSRGLSVRRRLPSCAGHGAGGVHAHKRKVRE